ncbi:MAG: Mur ligase family protein, partial [Ignavibacteria bacterium]
MIRSAEEILNINTTEDFEVNKLSSNSESVEKNDIFFALKGLKTDGNKFVSKAVSSGAKAVFSEQTISGVDVPVYKVNDCRKTMAVLSNIYFDYPSEKMKLIGVTGTNGKTTVTYIINHILESAGKKTGLIGTNGNIINKRFFETSLTTPESIDLNSLLSKMKSEDVEFVSMEVSSHSLALKRVYGLEFDTAVFTNLTSEHLDFHNSMEEYFEAKKILFDSLKRINDKDNRTCAVYNSDDLYGRKIVSNSQSEKISYGFHNALYT